MEALQLSKGPLDKQFLRLLVFQLQCMLWLEYRASPHQWCHTQRGALGLEVMEDMGSRPTSVNSYLTLDKSLHISEPHFFSIKRDQHLPAGLLGESNEITMYVKEHTFLFSFGSPQSYDSAPASIARSHLVHCSLQDFENVWLCHIFDRSYKC